MKIEPQIFVKESIFLNKSQFSPYIYQKDGKKVLKFSMESNFYILFLLGSCMKFTKEIISIVKDYIVEQVDQHPNDITKITTEHFGITKPTALKYVKELVKEGKIEKKGAGRYPKYSLIRNHHLLQYTISKELEEDVIWRKDVSPILVDLSPNVKDICHYGFTEMVNNVIDHSNGTDLRIRIETSATTILLKVIDNGVGIFNKIQEVLDLEDPRHSILELAKGKFTSDPENHTGEGIFFSSRMFDAYVIISYGLSFVGFPGEQDWLLENKDFYEGTLVGMTISRKSKMNMIDVFNEYTDPDKTPGFHKTIIPVELMQYEGESLISRSQAKRLIQRFDKFIEVILDFKGVKFIGQAFADQIFRVFVNSHPDVHIVSINTSDDIERMIKRAQNA